MEIAPPPLAGKYRTLYVDFPWNETGGGKIKRGADRHYDLMTNREIRALAPGLGAWADEDAHCYSWVTNNFLPLGLETLALMGFRYVTMITWVKDRMGIGQYYRGLSEHCLFGVRGRLPYRTRSDGKRAQGKTAFYDDPPDLPAAIEAPRLAHSRKPAKMRKAIELVSHGPYLELFARRRYPGWDAWGNEIAPESCPKCGTPSDHLACRTCDPLVRLIEEQDERAAIGA